MDENRKGLDAAALKWIAIISMLIDHIGAVVVRRYVISVGLTNLSLQALGELGEYRLIGYTYLFLRMVGRLAFPIFAFLIAEGVAHTKSIWKYALRLFAFAILSEIPFDLANMGQLLEYGYQNVMFTLLFGVLALWGFETIEREAERNGAFQAKLPKALALITAVAAICLAEICRTDYDARGVFLIVILYLTRKEKKVQMIAGIIATMLINPIQVLAFLPIFFYNGERGKSGKYFFYAFYPVHLLLLYGVACGLGLETFYFLK